jgi:hypothetical protein
MPWTNTTTVPKSTKSATVTTFQGNVAT